MTYNRNAYETQKWMLENPSETAKKLSQLPAAKNIVDLRQELIDTHS
jgi:hypothetical protein